MKNFSYNKYIKTSNIDIKKRDKTLAYQSHVNNIQYLNFKSVKAKQK